MALPIPPTWAFTTLEKTASVLGTALDAAGGEAQIFGLRDRSARSIDSVSGAFSFSDLPAGTYSFHLVPTTMASVLCQFLFRKA